MDNADAIEAINIDQLVTATDRLLVRCTRATRRPASRSTIDFSREAQVALAASQARATAEERTVHVRAVSRRQQILTAVAVIIGAWLGVVCACLLT